MIEGLDNEVTFTLLFLTLLLAIVIPLYVLKPNRNLNDVTQSNSNENRADNTRQNTSQGSSSSSRERPPYTSTSRDEPGVSSSSPIYCDGYNTGTRPPEVNTDSSRCEPSSDKTINVRVLHQETYRQMKVSNNMKLQEFKEACFPDEFAAQKTIRMIFAGKILQGDTFPLRYLGIMDGSVVHCVISEQNSNNGRNNEPANIPTNLDMSDYLMHLIGLSLIGTWSIFIMWTNFMSSTSIAVLIFLTVLFIGWTIYS